MNKTYLLFQKTLKSSRFIKMVCSELMEMEWLLEYWIVQNTYLLMPDEFKWSDELFVQWVKIDQQRYDAEWEGNWRSYKKWRDSTGHIVGCRISGKWRTGVQLYISGAEGRTFHFLSHLVVWMDFSFVKLKSNPFLVHSEAFQSILIQTKTTGTDAIFTMPPQPIQTTFLEYRNPPNQLWFTSNHVSLFRL